MVIGFGRKVLPGKIETVIFRLCPGLGTMVELQMHINSLRKNIVGFRHKDKFASQSLAEA